MCPYSRTAECQLERKWLQIAIDTTHNPQLAMPLANVHLFFFIHTSSGSSTKWQQTTTLRGEWWVVGQMEWRAD